MEAPKVEWVTKAIRFRYKPTPQTRELLSTFRNMVNDAIRICLDENIRGRLSLRNRIYKEFRERYRVLSYFPYSVAEVAWSIVKRHRRGHRKPRAKRLMMKIDGRSFRLDHFLLSIPFEKGRRLFVPLQFGRYQRSFLTDVTLKRGAMTMIEDHVIIAFSKRIERSQPVRRVGYDLNEKSVVGSDGMRVDLSDVARVHTLYGIRRVGSTPGTLVTAA